ncbi:MAG: hypothetical protein K0R73_995 [Candidatus Midichloriaceae bacterium]|nr:hypothetical protein [Candidatus Midichloriaceae bacterium]
MNIVGREREIDTLNKISSSNQAEFVVIYGRRRIGKTFLVQKFFAQKSVYLECTGIKDGSLKEQLTHFMEVFIKVFYPNIPINSIFAPPKTWQEAFKILTSEIKKIPTENQVIVFLDELPWLATPRSELLQNLDYFWNTEWSKIPNFKLIVCGSAASWMKNNLINAKGGLHNRVTRTLLLEPFNLAETKLYLKKKKMKISNKDALDLYMVMGGVPYYLNHLDPSRSIAQNITNLCFKKDGLLYNEFPKLFRSLFDQPELSMKIVKAIAAKTYGISLAELIKKTAKSVGGRFQEKLDELEAAGFIQKFLPYGRKKRDHFYRLIDPYCLFYLTWIVEFVEGSSIPYGVDYWSGLLQSGRWNNWAGYAFENTCLLHVDKIIKALGLEGIGCRISRWRHVPSVGSKELGAEIDLIIDRDDGAITLCEVKYSIQPFIIDKAYAKILANKIEVFERHLKPAKTVFLIMITTGGLKKNLWSEDLISKSLELKDLF